MGVVIGEEGRLRLHNEKEDSSQLELELGPVCCDI